MSLNKDSTLHKGYMLVSEPFLPDPNFERSVILICEHQEETGSFGLVLNKPTYIQVNDVTELENVDSNLFIGGPVEQNTLHFIHTLSDLEGAIPLKDGVYWGGNFEELREYATQGKVYPDNCRFFMGYSGWGKDQLKIELEQNAWIISKVDLNIIFEMEPDMLWSEILKTMGGKYKMFANYPTDPRLN